MTNDSEEFTFDLGVDAKATMVLCHGFTSDPASMRPWGDYLREHGFNVVAPLLPGHGETWQVLAKATWQQWYARLEEALDEALALGRPVFAGGLSMGGSLCLRLAEQRGGDLAGLVLVNPAIFDDKPQGFLAPVLRYVMPSVASIGSDVNKPDVREKTTSRTPVAAYASLRRLWQVTRPELARVTVPLRIFTSAEDHVVSPRNTAVIRAGVRSKDVESTVLPRSFHVATLDYDAETIFSGSVEFMNRQLVKTRGVHD
ncbi:alpha/beta hydrolase [Glycomyces algeriensis]|uniref:alpha/beta hydrolase n=1 Tax=Glycomyces algeriensis TaxID=256037 RepID=UPI0022D706CD|nr:alpha/beta fold hydrolase [Glycomyces algeriensis]MDA1365197.1 alpha/beta fold hydrolase [Glycomyces algeriensis]MDR7349739.1 carboxylesterase [Glycomyces algeriensis]